MTVRILFLYINVQITHQHHEFTVKYFCYDYLHQFLIMYTIQPARFYSNLFPVKYPRFFFDNQNGFRSYEYNTHHLFIISKDDLKQLSRFHWNTANQLAAVHSPRINNDTVNLNKTNFMGPREKFVISSVYLYE